MVRKYNYFLRVTSKYHSLPPIISPDIQTTPFTTLDTTFKYVNLFREIKQVTRQEQAICSYAVFLLQQRLAWNKFYAFYSNVSMHISISQNNEYFAT